MKEIIKNTYEIHFDGHSVGTVDISESGRYRWKTNPALREKAPVFTDKHLIFGCKENEWVDVIPFLKTRIEGAVKNGIDEHYCCHGTGISLKKVG